VARHVNGEVAGRRGGIGKAVYLMSSPSAYSFTDFHSCGQCPPRLSVPQSPTLTSR